MVENAATADTQHGTVPPIGWQHVRRHCAVPVLHIFMHRQIVDKAFHGCADTDTPRFIKCPAIDVELGQRQSLDRYLVEVGGQRMVLKE